MTGMAWNRNINNFKNHLKHDRFSSSHTVEAYLRDIAKLRAFCENHPDHIEPGDVTGEHLKEFLEMLTRQKLSERSQARCISAIKSFFALLTSAHPGDSPAKNLKAPKLGLYLTDALTTKQIGLLQSEINIETLWGKRDYCVIETLYLCGLTFFELAALKISNVNLTDSYVIIEPSKRRSRIIPLTPQMCRLIAEYLEQLRPQFKEIKSCNHLLFLNNRGFPMSSNNILMLVTGLMDQSGQKRKISTNSFRHSFATHLIENGADLHCVEYMLGHSALDCDQSPPLSIITLRQIIQEFHPRGCNVE